MEDSTVKLTQLPFEYHIFVFRILSSSFYKQINPCYHLYVMKYGRKYFFFKNVFVENPVAENMLPQ